MTITQAPDDPDRYREAGVDIAAGAALVERIKPLARATRRAGAGAELGGFGALFDLSAAGFADPLLVATTDGVGTKLLLAIEAGALATVGIDLVAMCVNDLVVQGATPLFFLDYFATGELSVERAATIVGGIAKGCEQAGCALVGGETAELPGLYAPGHFDLAGFAVGAVERTAVLPRPDVRPGDHLLGLASSGVHSNGYSLIRLILRETGADLAASAPFDPSHSLGARLAAPTRIYVKSALAALATGGVKAMAHITGGGLIENLPRALPAGTVARIDVRTWPFPDVFRWLAEVGRLQPLELARTFNAGIGLVMIVEPTAVPTVQRALEAAGEIVHAIGEVAAGDGPARVELSHVEVQWAGGASRS